MKERGWIKLHREFLNSHTYQSLTPEQVVITLYILANVNHKPRSWVYDGVEYHLSPGQMITSLNSIERGINKKEITQSKIRTCLKKLEKLNFITNKSSNNNRVITVVSWAMYQDDSCDVSTDLTKQSQSIDIENTNTSQGVNIDLTTNKNERMKECKNERMKEDNITNRVSYCQSKTDDSHAGAIDNIINSWNSISELQPVRTMSTTAKRYKMLVSRLREHGEDTVIEAVENIKKSSFLKGQNPKGWQITFDWFVKPNNFIKVLENQYADKKGGNTIAGSFEKNRNPHKEWDFESTRPEDIQVFDMQGLGIR